MFVFFIKKVTFLDTKMVVFLVNKWLYFWLVIFLAVIFDKISVLSSPGSIHHKDRQIIYKTTIIHF